MRSGTPTGCAGCSPVSTACAGCFSGSWSRCSTGHVSPRQLDKHLPDDWTDPFTGEHHDGGLFALLPKAVFRSEQFMGAALLYWMNRLPPAEFAEKLGSMSYLQGIATPESDPDTTNQTEKENTV